jgi:hypothetical protein
MFHDTFALSASRGAESDRLRASPQVIGWVNPIRMMAQSDRRMPPSACPKGQSPMISVTAKLHPYAAPTAHGIGASHRRKLHDHPFPAR